MIHNVYCYIKVSGNSYYKETCLTFIDIVFFKFIWLQMPTFFFLSCHLEPILRTNVIYFEIYYYGMRVSGIVSGSGS